VGTLNASSLKRAGRTGSVKLAVFGASGTNALVLLLVDVQHYRLLIDSALAVDGNEVEDQRRLVAGDVGATR
jgi:hypothetical protein